MGPLRWCAGLVASAAAVSAPLQSSKKRPNLRYIKYLVGTYVTVIPLTVWISRLVGFVGLSVLFWWCSLAAPGMSFLLNNARARVFLLF